ncbi:MAG: hypothetical protein H0W68_07090 [Gemmatimonadaceae bacterium]|nr:hypothetical protein [Gemmatimonadaceae bacterium]
MRHSLASGLLWSSVACCAIAQILILRSVLGASHAAEPTPGVPRARGGLELLWAVVPAVGLAFTLYFTWRAVEAPRVIPWHEAPPLPSREGPAT